jgi:methylamine dehydrogenase heavy chain
MGPEANTALVGDGRFLVVFDFTPGSGISVYDMTTLSRVSTIETPGCFLVYPTGARGVSMLCGDGRLLTVHLNDEGGLDRKITSEPFFDPDVDPIMENGVQIRGVWYFPSRTGDVYPVDLSGEEPAFHDPWPLAGTAEATDSGEAWLPGAPVQMAASNALRDELYVLMHPVAFSQGEGDFYFPGTEVWVYDVAKQSRVRRLVLENMAMTIYVTADEKPLLVTSAINPELAVASEDGAVEKMIPTIEVYDAVTGEYLRNFSDPGMTVVSISGAPGSGSQGGAR